MPVYFKGLVDVAVGEDEAAGIRKKPAPDAVYKAMKVLGATKEDSVFIGDSEVDVQTAQNAEMNHQNGREDVLPAVPGTRWLSM